MSTLLSRLNENTYQKFAYDNEYELVASKFVPDANWSVESMDIKINEDTGSPTGDVICHIYTDNAGVPGTSLGSGTISNPNPGGTFTVYTATFGSPISLTSGVTYWYVLTSNVQSASAYYSARLNAGSAGSGANNNGSTWTNNTNVLYCVLYGTVVTVNIAKLKTANSLAFAKIKTRNSLAVAKIKTINSLV